MIPRPDCQPSDNAILQGTCRAICKLIQTSWLGDGSDCYCLAYRRGAVDTRPLVRAEVLGTATSRRGIDQDLRLRLLAVEGL